MKLSKIVATLGFAAATATLSATAMAECPANASAEETLYCITVEGAGENYQAYVAEREAEMRAARDDSAKPAAQLTAYGEPMYVAR
jgi:hypothetical protein